MRRFCFILAVLLAFCAVTGLARAERSSDYYKFCVARQACGLLDGKGEIAVEPRFAAVGVRDGENIAVLVVTSGAFGANRKFGMVSFEDGLTLVEPQFDYIGFLGEGLIIVKVEDKYGYINSKGEIVIKPQFDNASDYFKNGLSVVAVGEKDKRKYGFIDTEGKWFLEPQFESADNFDEDGLASVKMDGKWGLINRSGKFIIEPKLDSGGMIQHGIRTLFQDGTFIYINSAGKYVTEPEKESHFWNGLRRVQVDWKWGYINSDGEMVIAPQFDAALEFYDEGIAYASKDGQAHVINTKGEILLTADNWVDAGKVADKGFIRFEKDKKWGLADYSGKVLAKAQYENMFVFEDNGLLPVVKDGKYGMLDTQGKVAIAFEFDSINQFLDNDLAIAFYAGQAGLINSKGEWVLTPQYDNMFESSGIGRRKKDILWAEKNGVTYYLNMWGEVLLYMEHVCDTDIARNAKGKIIYPANFSERCGQAANTGPS